LKKPYIFIPCIVDQLYPETGFAALKVLRSLGCEPYYNPEQTCCGQPAFNAGYHTDARIVAERFLETFRDAGEIVSLSGSCATMVKIFYPQLGFSGDIMKTADAVSNRIYEITQYIVDVLGVTDLGLTYGGRVAYHDSCHIMRELRITEQPRALLRSVRGLEMVELDKGDRCCGFGGLFSAKFPDISAAMGEEKLASIERAKVEYVVGCDSSCLMQLQGVAQQKGISIKTKHLIEFLADLMPA
jgi:L-lactate dehydrogenase complex protein LldE